MQYLKEKSVRIKSLYKQVLERTNELQVSSDVPTTNISLVDSANPPLHATGARLLTVLILSLELRIVCRRGHGDVPRVA